MTEISCLEYRYHEGNLNRAPGLDCFAFIGAEFISHGELVAPGKRFAGTNKHAAHGEVAAVARFSGAKQALDRLNQLPRGLLEGEVAYLHRGSTTGIQISLYSSCMVEESPEI